MFSPDILPLAAAERSSAARALRLKRVVWFTREMRGKTHGKTMRKTMRKTHGQCDKLHILIINHPQDHQNKVVETIPK